MNIDEAFSISQIKEALEEPFDLPKQYQTKMLIQVKSLQGHLPLYLQDQYEEEELG